MDWQFNLWAIPPLICGIVAISLIHKPVSPLNQKRAVTVIVLLSLTAIWNIANFGEFISADYALIEAMRKIRYIGIVFFPVVLFLYVLAFTGLDDKFKGSYLPWLLLVPGILLLLVFTNDSHNFFWASSDFVQYKGMIYLVPTYGYGFYLFLIYTVLFIVLTILVLIRSKNKSPNLYSRQNLALILAVLIPITVVLMDIIGIFNMAYSVLTPVSVAVSVFIVRFSLHRFQGGDLARASKGLIFDSLKEPVFVIDRDGMIIDVNHNTQVIIDQDKSSLLGSKLIDIFPELTGMVFYESHNNDKTPLLEKDGRTYEVNLAPIKDSQSQIFGTVVTLNDITTIIQQAADLNTILETAQEVSSTLDLKQVLLRFAERALEISGYQTCQIVEWDKESNFVSYLVEHTRGVFTRVDGEEHQIAGYPTTEQVLTSGKPVRVSRNDSDPESIWMDDIGVRQLLMLPLFSKDQVVGIVEVCRTTSDSLFSDKEESQAMELVRNAASWVDASNMEAQNRDLLQLACDLKRVIEADFCAISEWIQEEQVVLSIAEYSTLSWGIQEGPKFELAEWTSVAIALNEGVITNTFRSDPEIGTKDYGDLVRWGAKSLVVIPLSYQGRRIGCINLYNLLEEKHIEKDKLRLLQGIAEHAGISIQNAYLHLETQMKLREQTVLKDASAVISTSLELQTVLDKLIKQLAMAIDTTSAYIVTYDPETNISMVVAEYFSDAANPMECVSDLGEPYNEEFEWRIKLEQGAEFDISHQDDPTLPDTEKRHMQEYGVKSVLYIPIRFKGNIPGFAELWESRRKRVFTKDEISLCLAICQQAGSAIEHAMLFDQTQQEIEERKRTEEELRRKNRTLKAMILSSQVLLDAEDEMDLLSKICQIIVDTGGYLMAWVGSIENDEFKTIRPVAYAGLDDEYISSLDMTWADTERGQSSIGVAVRTGTPVICRDILTDPSYKLCRKEALKRGYASALSFPLIHLEQVFAALNVYAPEPGAFDEDELELLEYLANDIKSGVISLRSRYEHKKSQEALQLSEEKYHTLVDNVSIGVFRSTVEFEGKFLHANPAIANMLGYESVEAFINVDVKDIFEDSKDLQNFLKMVRQRGFVKSDEIQLCKKNGDVLWASYTATAKVNQEGELEYIDGVIEDISERKEFQQKLLHDATHDRLTNLPNRKLLIERLEWAIRRAARREDYNFALLYLDLDGFKLVNDSLGHLAGDKFLEEIADRLLQSIRQIDTVSRFGGDEFAILMEEIEDIHGVIHVVNRIQDILSQPVNIQGNELVVSASIGIVISSEDYADPIEYLRDADIAMYRAKSMGKSRYEIFNEAMREEVNTRLKLEQEIRAAHEQNQFVPYYQPLYFLDTREIIGFEALIRWVHPTRGLVFPGEFIRVAEESAIINGISDRIVRNACSQVDAWNKQYSLTRPFTLSVNIAGTQLSQPDFVDQITHILRDTGFPGKLLCLEITESSIIEDFNASKNLLEEVKKLGVNVHLDDFGTGYSSLNYLRQIPVDLIKIDHSFVRHIPEMKHTSLLRTMINMAHDLGMGVVAEGIETQTQMDELIRLGCEIGQGFYFSKAKEPLEIEKLFTKSPSLETVH